MKTIKSLLLIYLLFSALQLQLFSSENSDGGDVEDLRYDREILIEAKEFFIEENGDLPVKRIVISGLDKTKESVVLNESGISQGDPLSQFDPHLFINRLKKKNLFADLSIRYLNESGSAVINLSLHEKWSIIPLPMFFTNGETTVYGFYILEANFLGYGKTLFTGGTYSEDKKSAILGFVDPSFFGTQYAANLFLTYKDSINQNATMDKILTQEFRSVLRTARIDAGYTFSNGVKIFLSEGYNDGIVDKDYDNSIDAPDSMKFYLNGAVAKFDFLKYYEYLYYGTNGEISIYSHIPISEGKTYFTVDYKIDYSHKIFNFHRITLSSSGSAGNRPTVLEERIGGTAGTRTLPSDIISADNYWNYSLTYEVPFLRFNRGSLTLLCLWEQGIYNRDDTSYNHYYGPGGGILLYLKRIAFPAVGFNYARNLKTGNSEFSINAGYSF